MLSNMLTLVIAYVFFLSAICAEATLYVVDPKAGSTCYGGQPCTVTWLDDGQRPLLSAIGISTVGLFTGEQKLLQTITPVNVATSRSLTFTPNCAVGPDSDKYYIALISTELMENGTSPYTAFSPSFRLEGMTGSFDRPVASATEAIPIPSTLTQQTSSTPLSTITVGAPESSTTSSTSSRTTSSASQSPSPPPNKPSSSSSSEAVTSTSTTAATTPSSTSASTSVLSSSSSTSSSGTTSRFVTSTLPSSTSPAATGTSVPATTGGAPDTNGAIGVIASSRPLLTLLSVSVAYFLV